MTVTPGYEAFSDAKGGPLKPGEFGLVIKDDKSDKPFLVSGIFLSVFVYVLISEQKRAVKYVLRAY